MKLNKSFSSRIKVTKTGKLLVRAKNRNHGNALERNPRKMTKKKTSEMDMKAKDRARFLHKQ